MEILQTTNQYQRYMEDSYQDARHINRILNESQIQSNKELAVFSAKQQILSQNMLDRNMGKMLLKEKAKELERETYQEMCIADNGDVITVTKNSLLDARPRSIINLTSPYLDRYIRLSRSSQLLPCRINVIDMIELDELTQIIVTEMLLFFLLYFFKTKKGTVSDTSGYIVFIDEFQNFPLGKNSMIRKLLHESRKYKISLVLTTQNTNLFSPSVISSINQTATKLYFKPERSDTKRLSREIFSDNSKAWKTILENLQIGESIATGSFLVNDIEINRPLKLF